MDLDTIPHRVAQGRVPPCDGTHALTTWLLLKNLDKASLELAMNC